MIVLMLHGLSGPYWAHSSVVFEMQVSDITRWINSSLDLVVYGCETKVGVHLALGLKRKGLVADKRLQSRSKYLLEGRFVSDSNTASRYP
jgi:hypothetical protein